MRVVVDTSVWIARSKGTLEKSLCDKLDDWIDNDHVVLPAPVRVELICSCNKKQARELVSLLDGFHTASVTHEDFVHSERVALTAKLGGESHGFADLLIAAVCIRIGLSLWTLDSDFKRIAKIAPLKLI